VPNFLVKGLNAVSVLVKMINKIQLFGNNQSNFAFERLIGTGCFQVCVAALSRSCLGNVENIHKVEVIFIGGYPL
jgi:hypothetical protein